MSDGRGVAPAAAEPPLALAIDVGSSSARVALWDARVRPVAGTLYRAPVRWSTGLDGSVTTNAAELVDLVCGLLDRLVAEAPALATGARFAAVSTIFHSFVGVDRQRRPVTPLLSWADTSADREARALGARLDPAAIRERTGAPLHAGFWPARILRWRGRASPAGWGGLPELILHRLTGQWLAGASIAGGTGLLDRRAGGWDAELLDVLGLAAARLPALRLPLEPVGRLRADAAARWPALAGAEWLVPIGDGACGSLGLGAVGTDRPALMIGTSAAARAIVAGHPAVPAGLFAYPLGQGDTLLGGALSEGGGTAAWWSRTSGRPLDALAGQLGRRPPGSPLVLPYLAGERAPGYRADATFVVAGLRAEHGPADLLGAICEAVAIGLAEIVERLAAAVPATGRYVAAGGALTASPAWGQMVCDALGRPIELSAIAEPSLRGAAILALHSAGIAPLRLDPPPGRPVEPDPEAAAALAAVRARRRRLHAALRRPSAD